MLKTKIFHFQAQEHDGHDNSLELFLKDRDEHDKEINEFIAQLSNDGHTFIGMNSVAYGRFQQSNRIRTIIVYIENSTRQVIVEKSVTLK